MSKIKLYLYKSNHVHDLDPVYINTVPFSKDGILNECELVSPAEAEVFYMGQLSDSDHKLDNYKYLDQYREKHLIDIEGDWIGRSIPAELNGVNLTINGCPKSEVSRFRKVFIRPTFSYYLMKIIKRYDTFTLPSYKSFGFSGYPDPFGVRLRLKEVIKNFPSTYELTATWQARNTDSSTYEEFMLKHIFALCPRGTGHDSVRFLESCFLGRIPIVIGDNVLFEQNKADFAIQISQYASPQIWAEMFSYIMQMSWDEIHRRSQASREYFDKYVREYFKNPTRYIWQTW